MLFLLPVVTLAHATDVVVQYQPPVGRNAFVRFTEVEVGLERAVDLPCGTAPSCRLSMTLTPDGDQWRVAIRVVERRRQLFGGWTERTMVQPTFVTDPDHVASFFVGGRGPIEGAHPAAFVEQGFHVQAFVEVASPTASSASPPTDAPRPRAQSAPMFTSTS